ncbi:hypothetical protein R5R35_007159 [Gryllus longicercus]|uniref:Uncharacterized protein n=1 Tax=Gryllus longicercus TaxID=2509291 RepID=A0AAN9V5V3_9ORTH
MRHSESHELFSIAAYTAGRNVTWRVKKLAAAGLQRADRLPSRAAARGGSAHRTRTLTFCCGQKARGPEYPCKRTSVRKYALAGAKKRFETSRPQKRAGNAPLRYRISLIGHLASARGNSAGGGARQRGPCSATRALRLGGKSNVGLRKLRAGGAEGRKEKRPQSNHRKAGVAQEPKEQRRRTQGKCEEDTERRGGGRLLNGEERTGG